MKARTAVDLDGAIALLGYLPSVLVEQGARQGIVFEPYVALGNERERIVWAEADALGFNPEVEKSCSRLAKKHDVASHII